MLTGDDMYSFIIATCIFQLLWNLIVPLVMGTMASGPSGNVVIRFTLAAQTLGAALGPLMLVLAGCCLKYLGFSSLPIY